jgi:hypothetical protein
MSEKTYPDCGRLSFVADRDGKTLPKPKRDQYPRCWWHVKPTGDYGADCATGEKLGLEYLAFEAEDDGGGNLALIVKDMPRKLTGIEVGFLTMVSYAAGAGVERARKVDAYWDRCRAAGVI